jgi:three-Cys-motif partner protein
MAASDDREHFEDYRDQTRVKHEILAAYLPVYFNILADSNKNLNYLDGFAGPGTYTLADTGESIDGSPLRALKLIAQNLKFAQHVSPMFIERDEILYGRLVIKLSFSSLRRRKK